MTPQPQATPTPRKAGAHSWVSIWLAVLVIGVVAVFVGLPSLMSGRALVLPLDDVYIHFQYARQIAAGEPYIYNPGLPPSSGATSLLYPYLLAVGHWLGFTGLSLALWALAIGVGALFASCGLVYLLARHAGLSTTAAVALSSIFALTGSIAWHFVSGMETGLLVAFMLLTFYAVATERLRLTVLGASLMAVTRPEGAIMAVVAVGLLAVANWRTPRRGLWLALPLLALASQPLVNWVFTGSATAAGRDAKSILSMVPTDYSVIAVRVLRNFGRMWWEFLTGYSPREGLYLPVPLALIAFAGVGRLLWRGWRQRRGLLVPLVVLGWLGAGTLAVATLDPAFWHFKRYQMPFMALLFPLAAWGLAVAGVRAQRVLLPVLAVTALWSGWRFQQSYQINVNLLQQQQIPMAGWLRANTPPDAVIAVHDVGLMRYLTGRTTVDMVGLTTPGAADSWRNGPGAVAEFLSAYEPRPTYIASYTDALGLSYLADTGIYGELLVEYPVTLDDNYNVALAGAYQGVWATNWAAADVANRPHQPYPLEVVANMTLTDWVDVADLQSEAAHNYEWRSRGELAGFPTEVYQHDYLSCTDICTVLDGGRRIDGHESFTLATIPGKDLILITRVHAAFAGSFDVYINGDYTATRTLPTVPGQWLDIATAVDGERIEATTTVEITPDVPGGHYMPYYHWAYQGERAPQPPVNGEPLARFGDVIRISDLNTTLADDQLVVAFDWTANASQRADYRMFVHVYDDVDAPPIFQADRYPIDGATPPGNSLTGEVPQEVMIYLTEFSPGQYRVALGFYNPADGTRLQAASTTLTTSNDGRLWVETIELK
jgi:hypothetical protein